MLLLVSLPFFICDECVKQSTKIRGEDAVACGRHRFHFERATVLSFLKVDLSFHHVMRKTLGKTLLFVVLGPVWCHQGTVL